MIVDCKSFNNVFSLLLKYEPWEDYGRSILEKQTMQEIAVLLKIR